MGSAQEEDLHRRPRARSLIFLGPRPPVSSVYLQRVPTSARRDAIHVHVGLAPWRVDGRPRGEQVHGSTHACMQVLAGVGRSCGRSLRLCVEEVSWVRWAVLRCADRARHVYVIRVVTSPQRMLVCLQSALKGLGTYLPTYPYMERRYKTTSIYGLTARYLPT
jgi:hypothetical protein